MDFSSDEFFGTLGGSLMKDLLADLQVEDGDFSLDQLEKELAALDHEPPQLQSQPLPPLNAASLVVSHAQERASASSSAQMAPTGQGLDAWSLSLQNFTAMSLQDDFLAADSARKKQQQRTISEPIKATILDGAEEYDVGEKPALTPPPGLGGGPLPPGMPGSPPAAKRFPKTPQNSVILPDNERQLGEAMGVVSESDMTQDVVNGSKPPSGEEPKASQNPSIPSHAGGSVPPAGRTVPPMAVSIPGVSHPGLAIPSQPVMPGMLPPTAIPGLPMGPPHALMTPQKMQPVIPPPMMSPQGQPPPVVVATPAIRGPAWQAPPAAMPQPIRAFCNPHPAAPPIPATVLETKYMNARDIAYVVHSILKPVLAEGISEDDYYIQFLRRLGRQANPANPKNQKNINEEMNSRANKSKEWSTEKGVLGHVAKSNVARPRALIATPTAASSEQDSEQKQRATLWKARIYCDQAYQSYQTVVEIWRSAPPGGVPPQVQIHLVKLMKCMGITHVEKEYHVDTESLGLLLKLSKGRTLIARILEQALLPPSAVQTLLPGLLDVFLVTVSKKSNEEQKRDDQCNERLFRSIAGVLQKLTTSSDTLLDCLGAVQRNGKVSLASPARMECAHTLLQKGSIVVGQDPSKEKRAAWGKAEGEFMTLLQAY